MQHFQIYIYMRFMENETLCLNTQISSLLIIWGNLLWLDLVTGGLEYLMMT